MKIRVAPSIGELERTFEEAWNLETYNPETDKNEPTVFAGLYGLPDFYSLWRHKRKKYVWWAGSDIRHFKKGYWLDEKGKIKIESKFFAKWINRYCENWVENKVEHETLKRLGIKSKVCPSFLGNINDYKVSYQWSERPKVYTSVSGDDFKLYGWDKIERLADINGFAEFHLYGNISNWKTSQSNVFVHGRVSKEKMNEEIINMQAALRLTKFDGASEIIVKAMLMGQYAFSFIDYPGVNSVDEIHLLNGLEKSNEEGRNWWIKNLNKYPWI